MVNLQKREKQDVPRLEETLRWLAIFGLVPLYKLKLRPWSKPTPALRLLRLIDFLQRFEKFSD